MDQNFSQDYSFIFDSPVPEVLTTTRLRQPKSKVPGSTTIIQGDLIRDLGILNLVEVFRLVPGMTVAYVGSNKPVTSYHGTVAFDQRRLQVQIDGRTAYQPSLAGVEWNTMPVALEAIERIEISRGPNSAAYGINAFLGTINIITRSPVDSQGVQLHSSFGRGGHKNLYGSVADTQDDFSWRLSYQRREDDGFDEQSADVNNTSEPPPFNNGYEFNHFNYAATQEYGSNHSLELRAGVTDGIDEEDKLRMGEEFGAQTDPNIIVDDYYLQARWNTTLSESHFFHVQTAYQNYNRRQRWRTCADLTAIAGAPPGTPDLCAHTNQDMEESRLEFEVQDTVALSPSTRLVSGAGYREDRFESDTFFNGNGSTYQARLFANLEYTPINWLTFNIGGNLEKTSSLDDTFFSPRLAANFQLAKNHTLRFVFSEAVRTPDAFEQSADWGYRATNIEPAALYGGFEGQRVGPQFQAPGTLREEHIISREISYFGQYRLAGGLLSTEIKYFYDHLRDVISGYLIIDEWDLDNNVALDQQGFEIEASIEFPTSQFRATYAYMDQDGEYRGAPKATAGEEEDFIQLESRLTVRHSGSLAWIQRYGYDISSAVAYYFADEFKTGPFERLDLRLVKSVYTPRLSYEVAVVFQHYMNSNPILSRNNIIRDRNQFFIEAGLRF
ncbi:MAG: TonB-dependent receptor [Marinobacter sp.]|uniref:TonB-dependent receptor plug domain-containing protein n=1 Tax=Marinobacter sp. TaxID=50741 RepID=UPI0034A073AD